LSPVSTGDRNFSSRNGNLFFRFLRSEPRAGKRENEGSYFWQNAGLKGGKLSLRFDRPVREAKKARLADLEVDKNKISITKGGEGHNRGAGRREFPDQAPAPNYSYRKLVR